jgi:tRNA dimethylallyltransferase
VAIVGPTASGKSAVAMAVARAAAGTEIVAVDAFQVYRGMDIGTAKPTPADRAEIVHHGLDLADPGQDFSVVDYRRAYDAARAGIAARNARAVLVAGTGLYLRVAVDGLEPPGAWPAVRAELDAEPDTPALYDRLRRLDPAAAVKMGPGNRRRVVRALEVCLGSGRPFSTFGPGLDTYPPTPVVQVGLRWPRALLTRRIQERFGQLLAAGFLDEVRALAGRPDGLSRTARQAIGYAELLDVVAGRADLEAATARAVARTRRFAVRQERWFRRDPRVHWIDIDADPLAAVPIVLGAFAACV